MNRRRQLENRKRKNFCCAFILPMCNINYKNLPTNFINAYILDEYQIIMAFDKTEDYDVVFYHFLNNVKDNNKYLTGSSEDTDEILLSFKIPERHHDNYDLFKKGKYSEFDNEFKKLITNYFGNKTIKDTYHVTEYNAIYPQDFKKKQIAERLYEPKDIKEGLKNIKEVLEAPDMEKETFKSLQQLIEQSNNQQNIQYECKQ